MSTLERRFVIGTTIYTAVFCPSFCLIVYLALLTSSELNVGLFLVPLGALCIAMCYGVVFLAIRDLFKRSFLVGERSRIFWLALIIGSSGVGAFIYAFKHGFKPRLASLPS